MNKSNKSLTTALFLVFTLVPFKVALAQTETKEVFPALPTGSSVKIDGSDSLKIINENLKKPFEKHYPASHVVISATGTDAALKDLADGKIDIAGIGRPLTTEEKAKGLKEVVISRAKIAIITGNSNSYKGDMPLDKFAHIFKGDVKNWSQEGGASAPITLVDRPTSSDTRNAFKNYPIFKGDLKTGSNAVTVASDKTDDVVKKLGKNGIGYALIDQLKDKKDVKILSMHNVMPSDPRYPFSQPLYYIYKGPNPDPAVKAFLCYANTSTYATESSNHIIVSKEFCNEEVAAVVPSATPSIAPVPEKKSGFPWWVLLFAPLLALPFLLGKKTEEPIVVPAPVRRSRIVLTPRDCRDAYAYWEIPNERKQELHERGGEKLAIRLYDVTDNLASTAYQTIEITSNNPDIHIPIARDNRDYKAEIGYLTSDNSWLPIAESASVRVPACVPEEPRTVSAPTGYVAAGVATAGAVAVAAATTLKKQEPASRIVLVPRSSDSAYAYWEIPESRKIALRSEGGKQLILKIHDSTDLDLDRQPSHATQEYDVAEIEQDRHVPILRSDRDYVAEIGYKTNDGRWLSLARSLHVKVPGNLTTLPSSNTDALGSTPGNTTSAFVSAYKDNIGNKAGDVVEGIKDKGEDLLGAAGDIKDNIGDKAGNILGNVFKAGTAAFVGGAAALGSLGASVEKWSKDKTQPLLSHDRIELIPQGNKQVRVNWQISSEEKDALKAHGGDKLVLRFYRNGSIVWEEEIKESDHHQTISVPETGFDYVADIGYTTTSGQWLSLVKSAAVHIPTV